MFRVPVPAAVAERPLPEAVILDDSTPLPEPVDPRPSPRPIYKQRNDTPPPDESSRESSERRSGDRHRRRKRVRKKESNVSPGVLIALAVVGIAVLAGGAFAIFHFTDAPAGPKPLVPADDPDPSGAEGPAIPPGPTTVDLPKTWSMNAPSFGFKAAWPVPAGVLGYTPVESLTVGYNGIKPNTWAYTEAGSRIILSVQVIELIDDGTIDADATIDRYVDKIRRKAPTNLGVTPMSIGGQTARQISYVADGDRSISRVTVKGKRLWSVTVVCPQQIPAEDARLTRFLNFFQPL